MARREATRPRAGSLKNMMPMRRRVGSMDCEAEIEKVTHGEAIRTCQGG